MIKRILCLTFFLAVTCSSGLGQSSYKGLTPGKSTRAEVERVLGNPQKRISSTLTEYSGGTDTNKIYVQFANESVAAEVLRIELFCEEGLGAKDLRYGCYKVYDRLVPDKYISLKTAQVLDAIITREPDAQWGINDVRYHGSPAFVVYSARQNATGETELAQVRVGLYAKELYENAVPKSCTGTFAGVWETNRGRMTITRTSEILGPGEIRVKGEYSPNGTISGTEQYRDHLSGEWRDSTGRGTMSLEFNDKLYSVNRGYSFTGTWERTSGKGPKKGTWEGRCVEVKGGNN
jgi:hypothetical protein